MMNIDSCTFINANYFYITNNLWKHAHRTVTSPNNVIFVTEGTLYIEMGNQRYEVNEGELLFLPYGCESIGYRPCNVHTAFYCVMFKSDEIIEFPTHFAASDVNILRDLYLLLIEKASLADYSKQGVNTIMQCLFHEIVYQLNHTVADFQVSLSESIKKYVIGTLFRNVTVHDVAIHFGLSDDYVNRVFSKSEHITLKAYINNLRIKRIEEYLISTNTSLETVVKKLGFPNVSALSKFYKYHTGRTITEFRSRFFN